MIREVKEETSILLQQNRLEFLGALPIEYETLTINFIVFTTSLDSTPEVMLNPREHIDSQWITPEKALGNTDLMKDVDVIINKFCIGN